MLSISGGQEQSMIFPSGYRPISSYGVIGNLRTCALVGTNGSIDWMCFPDIDRPSVYAAILDKQKGGHFRLWARGTGEGNQEYLHDTNILETRFGVGKASLSVFDFMPLAGDIRGKQRSEAPSEVHRLVRCRGGSVDLEIEWSPRFNYANAPVDMKRAEGGWIAWGGGASMSIAGIGEGRLVEGSGGLVLRSTIPLEDGDEISLVNRWASENTASSVELSRDYMESTADIWRHWAHGEGTTHDWGWAGNWLPMLIRSELVLKLMTNSETGAIVAAPTTSLPETIGGPRNWDYRFSWIRDSALTAQALIALGHGQEAVEFLQWIEEASMRSDTGKWGPQIMYTVRGGVDLDEKELPHLEGYRGSRPVRIGNGAVRQVQLEVYGEILNTGYELLRREFALESNIMRFLSRIADISCQAWEEPDHSIWEIRGGPKNYTYSKVMLWVAMDRAVHLSEDFGLEGDKAEWERSRHNIAQSVLKHGYDREVGAFVQSYGSKALDAANLRIPLLEFLPFDDPRVQGTIDRTMEQLTVNGMVYRYLEDEPSWGKEGAFGLCTFWLVDALALSGRIEEAWSIFENMVNHSNHLGLLSEQIDPYTGEFLGNFPQAFTHIGLINSLIYLKFAEGKPTSLPYPIGTPEHRRLRGRVHTSGP